MTLRQIFTGFLVRAQERKCNDFDYMVHADVWERVIGSGGVGVVCLSDFERKLGRPLRFEEVKSVPSTAALAWSRWPARFPEWMRTLESKPPWSGDVRAVRRAVRSNITDAGLTPPKWLPPDPHYVNKKLSGYKHTE